MGAPTCRTLQGHGVLYLEARVHSATTASKRHISYQGTLVVHSLAVQDSTQ